MTSSPREPIQKLKKKKKQGASKKHADALFSVFIRLRDQVCVVCGRPDTIQCCHLVSRRYMATRFDPANAVTMCQAHHMKYTHNPLLWDAWCEERLGEQEWRNLRARALAGLGEKTNYRALCGWLNEAIRTLEAEA